MSKIINWLANIPHDKLLHSFYGVVIYTITSLVNPIFGFCVVSLVAIGKEVYDEIDYGGFDPLDILYTVCLPILLFIKDCIK